MLCLCSWQGERKPHLLPQLAIDSFADFQTVILRVSSGGPQPALSQWVHGPGLYCFRPHSNQQCCKVWPSAPTKHKGSVKYTFPWHPLTRGPQVRVFLFYRFQCECGIIVLPFLFSPWLLLICLVLTAHMLSLTYLHSFVLTSPCCSLSPCQALLAPCPWDVLGKADSGAHWSVPVLSSWALCYILSPLSTWGGGWWSGL